MLGVLLGVLQRIGPNRKWQKTSTDADLRVAGSIPTASTINTPSNLQRRPSDGVFLFLSAY